MGGQRVVFEDQIPLCSCHFRTGSIKSDPVAVSVCQHVASGGQAAGAFPRGLGRSQQCLEKFSGWMGPLSLFHTCQVPYHSGVDLDCVDICSLVCSSI